MSAAIAAWALHTDLSLDEVNLHLAALEAAGLLGIVEADGTAVAYFSERHDGLPVAGNWEPVAEQDWSRGWMEHFQPVEVGAVRIRAPWHEPGGDIDVVIDPGQAFGTGHHETTAGCLAALQELDLRGVRVLDVGTGSGIIAIAAALLGAAEVCGVDTDPLAITAAADNLARHPQVADRVRFASGSAADAGGRFDIVVANIDTATHTRIAGDLAARLSPGGTLVASGVSIERVGEAEAAFRAAGLQAWTRTGAAWAVLSARHAPGLDRDAQGPE